MLQISLMTIIGIMTAVILKKEKPEYGMLIVILISSVITMSVLGELKTILEQMEQWTKSFQGSLLGGNGVYIKMLLRMAGITYLCEFASNLCKDNGYGTLGNHIELFGKVMIFACGLPVLNILFQLLEEILQ